MLIGNRLQYIDAASGSNAMVKQSSLIPAYSKERKHATTFVNQNKISKSFSNQTQQVLLYKNHC